MQRYNCNSVNTNSDEPQVREATREVFAKYAEDHDLASAIRSLWDKITGVGIKSATLLLASAFPSEVIFFSRDLLRWASSPGETKEKFDLHSYEILTARVNDLRKRIRGDDGASARAVDVEKVAFVALLAKYMQGGTEKYLP